MQHIARCITIYNYRRVHSSLNWQIPHAVHSQKGPQIKKWKNYYKTQKAKGGHYAGTYKPPQKNIFFSCERLRKYFLPPHRQANKSRFVSTLNRMSIFVQPYSRIILHQHVNFFQDGSCSLSAAVPADVILFDFSSYLHH